MNTGGHQPCGRPLDLFRGTFEFEMHPAGIWIDLCLDDVHPNLKLPPKLPQNGHSNLLTAGGQIQFYDGHQTVGYLCEMSKHVSRLFLVDAFARAPFTGNPSAVVPLASPASEGWMQSLAMEMNQAETAFFYPEDDGYRLRWFTPSVEVDLCGHATLAAAHVIWNELGIHSPEIRFSTRSGDLFCRREDDGIVLDFPNEAPVATELTAELRAALPADPIWQGQNRMDHFVELESLDQLLATDWSKLMSNIESLAMRGLVVTVQGGDGVDFTSRCFFPQSGVPEDPVTGSAHCSLAPYWAQKLGRTEVTGYQASRRGGYIRCSVIGDRVRLKGSAITTLRGELAV